MKISPRMARRNRIESEAIVKQKQFLEVLDRDEAERRWREVVVGAVLPSERIPLDIALGRILSEDVRAGVDVPGFDRSNMDGFAVQAADTFGVSEEEPRSLDLNDEILATGIAPQVEVKSGTATLIATGGMLPRGADAVAPIEVTDPDPDDPRKILVRAPRVPGAAISFRILPTPWIVTTNATIAPDSSRATPHTLS